MKAMIDGSSYYSNQLLARGIFTAKDVAKVAQKEADVYDRVLLPHLPHSCNAQIYEAATGPGILQFWLRSRGYHNLSGSDFSGLEVQIASEITPSIRRGDSVADLAESFVDNSLDAVLALDFYEHITREQFIEFLSVARAKLKQSGVLILRGPNGDSPFVGLNLYNDVTHVWAYTTVCLRALTKVAGFQSVYFQDDSIEGLENRYAVKKMIMKPAQKLLTLFIWAATRQRICYWGSSIYLYARTSV